MAAATTLVTTVEVDMTSLKIRRKTLPRKEHARQSSEIHITAVLIPGRR